jgi:prepilin-type N-terminal cleavage/methylation domain-containing protein
MGRNSKPRKAYKPKAAHLPMMRETHDRLALKLHLTVEALITQPSPLAYNELTKKLATLTDAISHMRGGRHLVDDHDAAANALRTSVIVLGAIFDRWEKTKNLAVTAMEALSLRSAAGVLDDAIRRIPKNVFDSSTVIVRARANNELKEVNMKGFTLIEMMLLIAIVGILATVALGAIDSTSNQAGVSFGINGFTEVRCIDGYKFVIGEGGHARQVMDEMGRGVKCR